MQAFWVSYTIKATRAHTQEHILNILLKNEEKICKYLNENQLYLAKQFTKIIINQELISIQKPLKFNLRIDTRFNNKNTPIFKNQCVNFVVGCQDTHKKYLIKVDCSSNSWYYQGRIFWWAMLSALMVILIAGAVSISLLNQHKHKKLEQIKKDFVSNMTHELKTPIATISVASEMLLKVDNQMMNREKAQRYTQIIYDENQRLQKLVDNVLMLSIFDRSGNIYKMGAVDIRQIIKNALKSMELLITEKGAKLNYTPSNQPIIIYGDKSHLRQIIANIIENALKYSTTNPEISIQMNIDEKSVTIDISDNGPGIKKADKKLIFNKFHRVSNVDIHDVKGFGLGLFYVNKVMEAHGGSIKVKDNKPHGAVFQLTFPLHIE